MFDPEHYQSIIKQVRLKYSQKLRRNLNALKKTPLHLQKNLSAHEKHLKSYSDFNWFFLTQLEMLLEIFKKNQSLYQLKDSQDEEESLSPLEEEIFDLWSHSEFSQIFLERLNQGDTIKKASQKTLLVFDKHLCTLFHRFILHDKRFTKNYITQTSLGEYEEVLNQKRIIKNLLQENIHFDQSNFTLFAHNTDELKAFKKRTLLALQLIKEFSPKSFERFSFFTRAIVPLNDRFFVSYSHQNLPRYSIINYYHRDFMDLLDDLLHENGHHHLNFYLNHSSLIIESDEKMYFSPWRETLRPLRGIYHAYFTFYWAFQLFLDLTKACIQNNLKNNFHQFTKSQKEKIKLRFIEEYFYLNETFKNLKKARKEKLIYDKGWELIEKQQKQLKKNQKLMTHVMNDLKSHSQTTKKTLKLLSHLETL